jgi:hypothetical protein
MTLTRKLTLPFLYVIISALMILATAPTALAAGTITGLFAPTVTRSGYLEIRGTNLGSAGSVLIDGVQAPVAAWTVHYFVQNSIQLFALNPNGTQRWHVTLDKGVQGVIVDPATTQLVIGHAQSADQPGFILSRSADDGHELWRVPLPPEDPTIYNQWTGQYGFNQASDSRPRFRPDGAAVYMITFIATGDANRDRSFVYSLNPALSNGAPGIEPRFGGTTGDHSIVFTFAQPVTFTGATAAPATVGSATVARAFASSGDARQVTVDLTNVSDTQTLTVRLLNVNNSGDVAVTMKVLLGDTTGNGTVNASDVGQTKAKSSQPITNANFRADLTPNGVINASDVALAKSRSGASIPTPPSAPAER